MGDLLSQLDRRGHLLADPPLIERTAEDPVLGGGARVDRARTAGAMTRVEEFEARCAGGRSPPGAHLPGELGHVRRCQSSNSL